MLLILVPRHPERFPDARTMTQKAGFSYTLRSTGEILGQHPVVIGDTMGELMLLYGIADGVCWQLVERAVITHWARSACHSGADGAAYL